MSSLLAGLSEQPQPQPPRVGCTDVDTHERGADYRTQALHQPWPQVMPNDPVPWFCSGDGFLVGLREPPPPQNLRLWSPGNKAGQGSSEARCGLAETLPQKRQAHVGEPLPEALARK